MKKSAGFFLIALAIWISAAVVYGISASFNNIPDDELQHAQSNYGFLQPPAPNEIEGVRIQETEMRIVVREKIGDIAIEIDGRSYVNVFGPSTVDMRDVSEAVMSRWQHGQGVAYVVKSTEGPRHFFYLGIGTIRENKFKSFGTHPILASDIDYSIDSVASPQGDTINVVFAPPAGVAIAIRYRNECPFPLYSNGVLTPFEWPMHPAQFAGIESNAKSEMARWVRVKLERNP